MEETFEQLKEKASEYLRANVYNKYKTAKAKSYTIPSNIMYKMQDAFFRERYPEIEALNTKKCELDEEYQRNEEQYERIPKRQKEIMDECRTLLREKQSQEGHKLKAFYTDLFDGLEAERKLKLKQGKWKKKETEKKTNKRMKESAT